MCQTMKLHLNNIGERQRERLFTRAAEGASYIATMQRVAEQMDYQAPEASLCLAFDDAMWSTVQEMVQAKVSSTLRYIFIVGIGGSNLGTKAIYDALDGHTASENSDRPRLLFVDSVNSTTMDHILNQVIPAISNPEEYLLVSISKSGGTTETLANTEILAAALGKDVGDVTARTVVITDEGSDYWHAAESAGMSRLSIPEKVGGRYSVLSAVGLFPLLAQGLDVTALRQGAQDIRPYCLHSDVQHNPSWQSAAWIAENYMTGKCIHDMFLFNDELESLGKWYRQLLGESIGKEHDVSGAQVHVGITPTVSIGSTDLHSVGQLYLGGPKDKMTTFVHATNSRSNFSVPDKRMFPQIVSMIDGKTTGAITQAILGGVKEAYTNNNLPFLELELESISAYELGAFLQFKMVEVMLLGALLRVNPFDQPNVESYKVVTKRLLEG